MPEQRAVALVAAAAARRDGVRAPAHRPRYLVFVRVRGCVCLLLICLALFVCVGVCVFF